MTLSPALSEPSSALHLLDSPSPGADSEHPQVLGLAASSSRKPALAWQVCAPKGGAHPSGQVITGSCANSGCARGGPEGGSVSRHTDATSSVSTSSPAWAAPRGGAEPMEPGWHLQARPPSGRLPGALWCGCWAGVRDPRSASPPPASPGCVREQQRSECVCDVQVAEASHTTLWPHLVQMGVLSQRGEEAVGRCVTRACVAASHVEGRVCAVAAAPSCPIGSWPPA